MKTKTPKILLSASRQYAHNDGTGLLPGFDYDTTIKIVTELESKLSRKCEWTLEDDYENTADYDIRCGHNFRLTDCKPKESSFKFCPFCGGEIEEIKMEE